MKRSYAKPRTASSYRTGASRVSSVSSSAEAPDDAGTLGGMNSAWIEHRRGGDGERLGWMAPSGDDFVVIDLLGRERSGPVDWLTAEETLDALGIGYLADLYEFRLESGEWLRVRIAEVSPTTVRVKKDDWGAVGAPQVYYSVPFPASEDSLRSLAP